jgi:hypothetical protein
MIVLAVWLPTSMACGQTDSERLRLSW